MSPLPSHSRDVELDRLHYNSPTSSLLNNEPTSSSWNHSLQTSSRPDRDTHDEGNVKLDGTTKLSKQPSRIRLISTIIGLSLTAILPGVLGLAFYLSLGIGAHHGEYLFNGTYIRPNQETLASSEAWSSVHLSPLLISSVSSTLVGIIAPWVMMLFAYHLANLWIKISHIPRRFESLPSPFQYFLTMDFINNATPFSMIRFLLYAFKPSPSDRQRLSFIHRRPLRTSLSPILLLGFVTLLIVLAFTWSIKIIDVILHDQIFTVVQHISKPKGDFKANAMIAESCTDGLTIESQPCDVRTRTLRARQGGANSSSEFRVYQATPSSKASMSYIGPALPDSTVSFTSSHTYAAASACEAFHPSHKSLEASHSLRCKPGTPPPHGLGPWNSRIYTQGFETYYSGERIQSFITVSEVEGRDLSDGLHYGSNINPFTIATFGCFKDYVGVDWNNDDQNFHTPFINLGYGGPLISSIPSMCSILICNITVYDAQYNLTGGKLELIDKSLTLANVSATLAISGSAIYNPNSTVYQTETERFLNDHLQADLNAAGNQYGNNSQLFASAWAQALSNRLVGWSLGAIELQPMMVNVTQPQIATSIPLTTAYIFLGLHILFSLLILLLGISALFLPGVLRRNSQFSMRNESIQEDPDLIHTSLSLAHDRLSDPTSLIHELINTKPARGSASSNTLLTSMPTPPTYQTQTISNPTDKKKKWKRLQEYSEGEQLKVALIQDPQDGLELDFL